MSGRQPLLQAFPEVISELAVAFVKSTTNAMKVASRPRLVFLHIILKATWTSNRRLGRTNPTKALAAVDLGKPREVNRYENRV